MPKDQTFPEAKEHLVARTELASFDKVSVT